MNSGAQKKRVKNKELTFPQKIEFIKEREKSNKSEQWLANKFEISKSQVHRTLKNKELLLQQSKNRIFNKRSRLNRESFYKKLMNV